MNKEQKYNDALRRAKELHEAGNVLTKTQMEIIFPELAESEDERIRKEIVSALKFANDGGVYDKHIAYLEKQKERDLDIVPELRPTAWGEGYQHGRKDTEEKYSGMMVCSPEEWNEAISDAFKHGMDEGEKRKEQNSNIELIQKSWYMEGYHDCEFGYEPRWIIKTGEGGPRYEENPKYGQIIEQKPVEKQDYSGLTELEQAIHRGFLCAGVVNVPVNIIKETAQDCLAHLPVEWSKEDRRIADRIQMILEFYDRNYPGDGDIRSEVPKYISWLKSLRPSWKPSEEPEEPKYYQHFDPDC